MKLKAIEEAQKKAAEEEMLKIEQEKE